MNYTDGVFFLFFAAVFVTYYLVRQERAQIAVLIAASLFFYAWEAPVLLAVFLTSWLITSTTSFATLTAQDRSSARTWSTLGVVANLGMLGFFKYKFLFLTATTRPEHIDSIGQWLILAPLPIGISFYSFHGISLLIDVYRGNQAFASEKQAKFSRYLTDTLLYLVFFPQLIAGPIIKAKNFYPQVGTKRLGDIDFQGAARTLIVGYFLKSVIADNLSEQTYWIAFPYFQWKSTIDLWVMLLGYSAQIFADFAGYSLIAIGLGMLLGYKLPDNFNFPYLSSSISDFWRRWHISLSSWLRDYLYIPLGGSRCSTARTYFNLIVVMFLGGLWHGAALSFAVWGLWHGIGLAIERPWLDTRFMKSERFVPVAARVLLVFAFVTIGWLFFKLQHFADALLYLRSMLGDGIGGYTRPLVPLIFVYGLAVALYHFATLIKIRQGLKNVAYGVMLFLIITNAGPSVPFIYFQF